MEQMGVWEVVPIEEWMHIIPSTVAFLIKRNPDLIIKKFKAREDTLTTNFLTALEEIQAREA